MGTLSQGPWRCQAPWAHVRRSLFASLGQNQGWQGEGAGRKPAHTLSLSACSWGADLTVLAVCGPSQGQMGVRGREGPTSGGIRSAGVLVGRDPSSGWPTVYHQLRGALLTHAQHSLSSPAGHTFSPAASHSFCQRRSPWSRHTILSSLSLTGAWSWPPLPPGPETMGPKRSHLC